MAGRTEHRSQPGSKPSTLCAILSTMNQIDKIRAEILQYFNPDNEIIGSGEILFSPSTNYKIHLRTYRQNDPDRNWEVTCVDIFTVPDNSLIFSFFVNEGTFFHSWVTKNRNEYLLCAEDACGGQTIINLTNKEMSSFASGDDGLIWTKHLLSPDEKLLAVFGCGWASPFFITVYDFDSPLSLPLKVISQPNWTGYDMVEWVDNKSLQVKNSETEYATIDI